MAFIAIFSSPKQRVQVTRPEPAYQKNISKKRSKSLID
jgi:hypothetical protein